MITANDSAENVGKESGDQTIMKDAIAPIQTGMVRFTIQIRVSNQVAYFQWMLMVL